MARASSFPRPGTVHGPAVVLVVALSSLAAPLTAGDLTVTAVSPAARTLGAPRDTNIAVTFDRPVDPATVVARDTFWAFGRWSGTVDGTFSFAGGNQTVILTPARPLAGGESVLVILSHDLMALDGSPLRAAGYAYQFWVAGAPSDLELTEADRLTTRTTPGESSRAYGGLGTDLDGDGYPEITIVNEDTGDLRVFMNRADGSGLFDPFLQPTTPVGSVPSPSESGDFDRDGLADFAVANVAGNSVSIVLGNGDGTFGPDQEISVGGQTRGIAVLDSDGDGDLDVAVNSGPSGDFAILPNNGSGVFGAPQQHGSGSSNPWGLGAADMNEDGILDLVSGRQDAQTVTVWTGNGDGTFSAGTPVAVGGSTWMLALGDVSGDGHEDVTSANSGSGHGSVLTGDGAGGLGAPQTYVTDPFTIATDLGDLDGDGDLDWILASFSGDWRLFLNDGAGAFVFDREFPATQAASCSLMVDMDADGDLDLALIDELADEVILVHNGPTTLFADGFESGDTSSWSTTLP
jgi:FG-GAP-like repeat/Bacterial Ig-like domain